MRFDVDMDFLGEGPVVKKPPNHYTQIPVANPGVWDKRLATLKKTLDQEYREEEKKRKDQYKKKKGSLNRYEASNSNNAQAHYRATLPYLMEV
jgi:hypothetical protein